MTKRPRLLAPVLLAIAFLLGAAGCGGDGDEEADERLDLAVASAELAVAAGDAIRTATTTPGPESREAAEALRGYASRARELAQRAGRLEDGIGRAIAEMNEHTRRAAAEILASLGGPQPEVDAALAEASRAYSRGQSAMRRIVAALGDRIDERQASRLERVRIEVRNSRDQFPATATARLEQTPPEGGEPQGDGGKGYIGDPAEAPLSELDP